VTGRLDLFSGDLDEAQTLGHARYLPNAGLDPFEDRGPKYSESPQLKSRFSISKDPVGRPGLLNPTSPDRRRLVVSGRRQLFRGDLHEHEILGHRSFLQWDGAGPGPRAKLVVMWTNSMPMSS